VRPGGLGLDRIFELFPNLRERLSSQGTKLSGGEQQMLAIAASCRTGAELLLLDEPTEGLAPVIIQQIGRTIGTLKAQGFTILLVEQNFHFAATLADRYYVMEHGRIVDHFSADELKANTEKLHDYLVRFDNQRATRRELSSRILAAYRRVAMTLTGRLVFAVAALTCAAASAQAQDDVVVKIGVLSDMSSLYSDIGGAGSVAAAKLAVEDFSPAAHGMKVEVISADHQNKPMSAPASPGNGTTSTMSTLSSTCPRPASGWRSTWSRAKRTRYSWSPVPRAPTSPDRNAPRTPIHWTTTPGCWPMAPARRW